MPHPPGRISRRSLTAAAAAGLLAVSCGTSRPDRVAPCIGTAQEQLRLRWGTQDDSTGTLFAWEMNSRGEISAYGRTATDSIPMTYLGFADGATYCTRVAAAKDAFLQTQAMNVRGVRARFVEYVNPPSDVYLRVVWNPDLTTFQSRIFRAQYDSLMMLVPAP